MSLHHVAPLAAWPTPIVQNCKHGSVSEAQKDKETLDVVATLASWATPSQIDFKSNDGSDEFHQARLEQSRGKPLSEQAHQLMATGATPSGSHAGTEKRGQLNPALSRWLMGLPPEWDACAVTAMQSLPRRQKRS
jgi:hypothetical protein